MRKKYELYKNEQDEIINNIVDLLNLDNIDYILLHDLDNDINKQNKPVWWVCYAAKWLGRYLL
jgi:predicted ATP-grasp superfamily ATP-dependent carboligase